MAEHMGDCLARLVAYVGSLHIAHWEADTVTNEHKALGDLYDAMQELADKFAENYLGAYGMVSFPKDAKVEDVSDAPCAKGLELVYRLQGYFEPGEDDDLLNTLADMQGALNKAKYLLKEKGDVETEEPEEDDVEEVKSSPKKAVEAAKRTYTK